MNETLNYLEEAAHEIRVLRHQNLLMSAKLAMFNDVKMMFLATVREESQGVSPDLLYSIEKHIKETERQAKENQKTNSIEPNKP